MSSDYTSSELDSGITRRNPTWRREELILALELYVAHAGNPPGKASSQVSALSDLLNRVGDRVGRQAQATYRNANGVYMKMMNFRRLDPAYIEAGRKGLSRGGAQEAVIWREFANDYDALRRTASAIRAELSQHATSELDVNPDDESAAEGAIIMSAHRRRERNRELVRKRKQKALREHGELRCEGCSHSFADQYGERGEGFIEVHHLRPVHQMDPEEKTRLADLALVCANCHRMIHRRAPWLSMQELRDALRKT